ncbi:type III intermediate filament-like protein, partial [Leptotrombidium deliense]
MRNLNISSFSKIQNEFCANIRYMCQNCFSGLIYLVNGNNELFSVNVDHQDIKKLNFAWKSEETQNLEVVSMCFLMDEMGVCIAFASGEIVVYDCENETTSCVASITSGISNLSVSPDQELIVIITNESSFILMDKMFDPICEKVIDVSEFGCGEAVNVGWGSKQTQFHGS